jgi:hypothetical protein
MTFLTHKNGCPACGEALLFQHCNPCHRLFLHCEACEVEVEDVREPRAGRPLPPVEHPTCPKCEATEVRPATRSDLENRDLMAYLKV